MHSFSFFLPHLLLLLSLLLLLPSCDSCHTPGSCSPIFIPSFFLFSLRPYHIYMNKQSNTTSPFFLLCGDSITRRYHC